MYNAMIYLFIFIGVIIGILCERYLFVILDLYLQVFQHKQSVNATMYQLQSQEAVILFNREYPESNSNKTKELSSAIGFACGNSDDVYYEDEIEDCRK